MSNLSSLHKKLNFASNISMSYNCFFQNLIFLIQRMKKEILFIKIFLICLF